MNQRTILIIAVIIIFILMMLCLFIMVRTGMKRYNFDKSEYPDVCGIVKGIGGEPFPGLIINGKNYMVHDHTPVVKSANELTQLINKKVCLRIYKLQDWINLKGMYPLYEIKTIGG